MPMLVCGYNMNGFINLLNSSKKWNYCCCLYDEVNDSNGLRSFSVYIGGVGWGDSEWDVRLLKLILFCLP